MSDKDLIAQVQEVASETLDSLVRVAGGSYVIIASTGADDAIAHDAPKMIIDGNGIGGGNHCLRDNDESRQWMKEL